MLQPAPSLNIAQDQLTVFYAYAPRAHISLLARLTLAYNPYGALPPDWESLEKLTRLNPTARILSDIHRRLSSRDAAFGSRAEQTDAALNAGAQAGLTTDVVTQLGAWFALGGLLTPVRDHLFAPTLPGQPVGTGDNAPPSGQAGEALTRLANMSDDGGWLNEEQVADLAAVTIWAQYERLTQEGSALTRVDEAPPGAPKEVWATAQRVMRIIALAKVVRDSIEVAPMRELAALLTSPAFAPLLEYVSVDLRERVKDYTTRLLALPVHPWVAEAERLRLPAKRYTEWGNASHTMGLSGGPTGMWTRLANIAVARDGVDASVVEVRSYVTDPTEDGLIAMFVRKAQSYFMLRDMFPKDMLDSAAAALGLTHPTNPPPIHLHGQTWKALIQTGAMASEAVTDVMTLMLRPRFALLNSEGWSRLAGNTNALLYNAMYWATGQNGQIVTKQLLSRPVQQVPLFVQPQHPEHIVGYGLREITPQMVQPVIDTEYFGDEDAVFAPFTVAGIADLLGFPDEDALRGSTIIPRLGHLLERKGGQLVPRADVLATRVFHSSRTRQPWRKAVIVPNTGMPTQTLAMDERTSPSLHDIEAVVIRTPDQPAMTATTIALADAAAIGAAKSLGVTL